MAATDNLDLSSSAGPAPLNGAHEPSSAELSPTSSGISSESPTVAPTLTFRYGTNVAGPKDAKQPCTTNGSPVNGSHAGRRFFNGDDVDDFGIIPKTEEIEYFGVMLDIRMDDASDDFDIKPDIASLDTISDVTSLDVISPAELSSFGAVRRPRGRPPKNPKSEPTVVIKKPMGRSKTGCITCRKRKKKCDERKPTCMHCEKNNVHCEGYRAKGIWLSGKQKQLAQNQQRWSLQGSTPLPSIMPGVENELDWSFFEHFNLVLSDKLSLHPDKNNPFREQLLPMAQSHRGLMHSLLSLSGTHLLQRNDSKSPKERIEDRSAFHYYKAISILRTDERMDRRTRGDTETRLDPSTVAQVVVLCLQTICEGNTNGNHLLHLNALHSMLQGSIDVTEDGYQRFLYEFLIYHDMASSMTATREPLIVKTDFNIPSFITNGVSSFLSPCDGLLSSTSKTRHLRDRVRKRREEHQRPYVDFSTIMEGKEIDNELKGLECQHEVGSDEWITWNLYKTTFWLYLHRTINNSTPSNELENGVSKAIEYLHAIPSSSSVQSVLLTPIFIVACAAFNKSQRPAILEAFNVLENYSSLGNIKHAQLVVKKVWELMDTENDKSWDWEGIMEDMGMNFLIT